MGYIKLEVDSNTKNIPEDFQDELYVITGNGIEVMPKDLEEFPMPWDAEAIIEGSNLILVGHVGPSGFGKARAELPLNSVSQYLEFSVYAENEDNEQRLIEIFEEYGWL